MIEGIADSSERAREQQFCRAVSRSGPPFVERDGREKGKDWPGSGLAATGGTRDNAARRSVYGCRALWAIQIWPCTSSARAGPPSAAGCGRRWRARPYSKGNSKWSVQASAGFILKSGDRLHWNPKPSDLPKNGHLDGRISGPIWTRFHLALWMSALPVIAQQRKPSHLLAGTRSV